MNRALGIALIVVGALLLYFGYNASQSVSSEVSEIFNNRPSRESMWFFVGGAGALIFGLILAMRK